MVSFERAPDQTLWLKYFPASHFFIIVLFLHRNIIHCFLVDLYHWQTVISHEMLFLRNMAVQMKKTVCANCF